MKKCTLAAVALALALAPGGTTGAPATSSDPSFTPTVDHRYFPLVPGRLCVYEGEEDGLPVTEEVRTLEVPRVIAGVACTALEERRIVGGVFVDLTTEWFAQDAQGNVWKFGEESFESDRGLFVRSDDSWFAGSDGARPWMTLAALPRVGERYFGYRPNGIDVLRIGSLSETVAVPAGTFVGCIEVFENPDDPEDRDIILYAPGLGMVSETSESGFVRLVSVR